MSRLQAIDLHDPKAVARLRAEASIRVAWNLAADVARQIFVDDLYGDLAAREALRLREAVTTVIAQGASRRAVVELVRAASRLETQR